MSAEDCLEHTWLLTEEVFTPEQPLNHSISKDTSDSGRDTYDSGSNTSLESCAESMRTAPESVPLSDSDEAEEFVIAVESFHGCDVSVGDNSTLCCDSCKVSECEGDVSRASDSTTLEKQSDSLDVSTDKVSDKLTVCSADVSVPKPSTVLFETLHEADEENELSAIQTVESSPLPLPTKALTSTVPVPSPMASPIGCRRALVSSPQTIKETEPSTKHLCRREDTFKVETTLLLDMDLAEERSAKADRRSMSCLSHKNIQLHKVISPSQKAIHLKSC